MSEFNRLYPNDIHVAAKENETIVSLEIGTECICGTERVCRSKAKEVINGIAAKENDSIEILELNVYCGTERVCRAKAEELMI